MKTKTELSARHNEICKQVAKLESKYEALRKEWKDSQCKNGYTYAEMRSTGGFLEKLKREQFFYGLLSGDKRIYANQHFYTDVEPWEVVEIKSERLLVVRPMKATIKPEAKKALHDSFTPGGFCGHFDNSAQEWDYESDPNATTVKIRRHKDGAFYMANDSTRFVISDKPCKHFYYNF